LKILKEPVIEPTLVNTVSNDKVSLLVYKLASGLVINESFLHEKRITAETRRKTENFK
jgi:hypothetical protein